MPSWPITGIALPVRRGGFSRPADANSQPLIDFLYGGNGDLTPISVTPISGFDLPHLIAGIACGNLDSCSCGT
jgi:hypothetical protein